ncbi:M50 family metallopeptidase [Amycolatopsis rhizosphaerae]|uniref:M50 family metallopeptidase n=1 Tax=Amycolatopsis rhizosphaerae TaxID=2053003 RepID=A0A558BET3_9PSEU|nr:M50 family metallopeptidase [Amycolatopsis rhizosphaerae]TVT35015.1 M50 family metallopeptidase [Amycolatopsis rhizosphaerae]
MGLFGAQPGPTAWVPVVTGAVALLLVLSGAPWRWARNLVTIVHEAGHALMALLAGRRLQGIKLHSDTSGVTVSRGKPHGPGMVLTSLAGYPAPGLLGLAFAALLEAGRITVLLTIAALLLLGVLVMIRNAYGVLSVLVTAGGLALLALVAGPEVQAWFVYLITWFLLFGGLRPVFELQHKRRRGAARDSDADQLARLTAVPAGLWVLILVVLALTCLLVGGAWLLEPALRP